MTLTKVKRMMTRMMTRMTKTMGITRMTITKVTRTMKMKRTMEMTRMTLTRITTITRTDNARATKFITTKMIKRFYE